MKTPDEFKQAVYRKRDAHLQKRKSAGKRAALFCVPLLCAAALLTALLFLLPDGKTPLSGAEAPTGNAGSSGGKDGSPGEPSVQVLAAEPPEDLSLMALALEREQNGPEEYASTSGESAAQAQENEEEEFEREWQRRQDQQEKNALDPEFPGAVNGFARDSAALLAKDFGENACYSPMSLYCALALAGSGARGDTEREFLETLNAPSLDWLSEQCAKYYRQQYRENPFSQFRIANSLWLDGRAEFQESFLNRAGESFYASLFQADFSNPALGDEMGRWVSGNTNGLLSPELTVSSDDRLAILNTVYLCDQWADRFSEENNTEEPFYQADGAAGNTTFLHSRDSSGALRGSGFSRASLGLRETGEMIFILPDEGVSPQELLADPDAFEEMFFPKSSGEFQQYQIEWSIPKFSFGSKLDLNETLAALGLETAFDETRADFQGISSSPEPLFLSSAKQGVQIGINENGVEAASYTALMMAGAAAPPPEVLEMKLDRPFLFAVVSRDRLAEQDGGAGSGGGTLLFVGVCGNPAES